MTKLLISVKNVEEAMLALAADVDMIDLKEPSVGALGALDLNISRQIVQLVSGRKLISATVGEEHRSMHALILDIQERAAIGVDIIKIAVSDFFYELGFIDEMLKLSLAGIKIVAVFFADGAMDLTLLPKLQQAGFYGAMLDTQTKQNDLLSVQTKQALHLFTQHCHQYQLVCGLAGSLKPQYVATLLEINPTYIGFRGGVCENFARINGLNQAKIKQVLNMLHNGNKNNTNPHVILGLALHS